MGKGKNAQSRGELVHFQLSRIELEDTPTTVAIRKEPSLAIFATLRRRDLGTSSPHVAILALKSSDLFVVYLSTLSTCSPFPTSRRRRRIAQLNTIRSVLCFFFFFSFCNYFTVPARAVDQRIRCRSIAELFFFLESLHDYSLRITSLLKLFPIRKVPSSRPTTEETSLLICYIGSGAFARICRLANARIFLSHHPPSCF